MKDKFENYWLDNCKKDEIYFTSKIYADDNGNNYSTEVELNASKWELINKFIEIVTLFLLLRRAEKERVSERV